MSFASAPTRLPSNFLAIAVAAVVACGGYLLFSARYGEPVRKANAAAASYEALQQRLPETVTQTVRQTVADLPDLEARVSDAVGQRVAGMDQIIAALNDRIRVLESEVAALKSRPVGIGSTPIVAVPPSPSSSAPNPGTETVTTSPDIVMPTQPAAVPAQTPAATLPTGILARATQGDLQVDLLSIRVADGRLVGDITVTRTAPGDGGLELPPSGRNARVVTTSGVELSRFEIAPPAGRWTHQMRTTLISQTPMQYQFSYRGELPVVPFVCRRLEFTLYGGQGSRVPLLFQFNNIAVTQ